MKIIRDLNSYDGGNSAVTIGFFDGVHSGHRALLDSLKKASAERNLASVVITFAKHPRESLRATYVPKLLTTLDERLNMLEDQEIDICIVLDPEPGFFEMTSEQFVKHVLSGKLQTKYLITGYDHHFGCDRENGFDHYKKLGDKYGIEVERQEPFEIDGIKVSSSMIRKQLDAGEMEAFKKFAGYNFFISGIVVSGRKIGHGMGYPTANIAINDVRKMIPHYGVYAVDVKIEGFEKKFHGMLNIGIRPTFVNTSVARSIEVHIFDFNENIYKRGITVYFRAYLRNENKFDSAEKLSQQLHADYDAVQEYFEKHKDA